MHTLSAQDVLSEPKLGQSARYCWQYAVVNYASVVRLCEAQDAWFKHHPWKIDFEPFLTGKQVCVGVCCVAPMCTPCPHARTHSV